MIDMTAEITAETKEMRIDELIAGQYSSISSRLLTIKYPGDLIRLGASANRGVSLGNRWEDLGGRESKDMRHRSEKIRDHRL